MASTTSSLDALCAALAASFDNANLLLTALPPSALEDTGELSYTLFEETQSTPSAPHAMPLTALFPQRRLALQELHFQLRCYRIDHASGPYDSPRGAIAINIPTLWQRIWHGLRPLPLPLRLDIHIIDGTLILAFHRAVERRSRRRKRFATPNWIFLLNREQERQIDLLHRRRAPASRWHRIARTCRRWLRRLTGNVMS